MSKSDVWTTIAVILLSINSIYQTYRLNELSKSVEILQNFEVKRQIDILLKSDIQIPIPVPKLKIEVEKET